MPKSTFFYEPRQESPDSKRGYSKPSYSKTLGGAYISDEMIKTLLFDLAEEFPFFGYKKLTFLLRSKFGIIIKKKKSYKLCNEIDLLLPIIRHYASFNSEIVFKKVILGKTVSYVISICQWVFGASMDIFILDIIDTYTLEIVGYKAGFSITKNDVVKTVTKAIASRHITDSLTIRTDNGP